MFYLTTLSTHFIYGYMAGRRNSSTVHCIGIDFTTYCSMRGRKEGNVLFNDTLNTFYLQLYGVSDI